MNQLQRELFEEARRELDEILSRKRPSPQPGARGDDQTIVLYGPVSIQRLVVTVCKRNRETKPLRSENHELM